MTRTPEIRIKDAFLLRWNASEHLHTLWGKKGERLADDEDMQEIVSAYKKEWHKYENKILASMTSVLNLAFYKDVIDVYIAPWFSAFSDPLVIGVVYTPDEFVDHLTHELIHILLTDNDKASIDSRGSRLGEEWAGLFGAEHSFDTLVHIPVHAVHKHIYIDVFKDDSRLKRDIALCRKNKATDYVKAWEYVEKTGQDEIIKKLKDNYDELKTS